MATCSSCGAEILWALTDKGRRIPLDAKPEKRFLEVISFDQEHPPTVMMADTYQTHFATCPNAAEHRRKS